MNIKRGIFLLGSFALLGFASANTTLDSAKVQNVMKNFFARNIYKYTTNEQKLDLVRQLKSAIRNKTQTITSNTNFDKLTVILDSLTDYSLKFYTTGAQTHFNLGIDGKLFDIGLAIPDQWNGNYGWTKKYSSTGDTLMLNFNSKQQGSNLIFGISVYNTGDWAQMVKDGLLNMEKITTQNGDTFAYFRTLDMPFTGYDGEEYLEFVAQTQDIINSFKINAVHTGYEMKDAYIIKVYENSGAKYMDVNLINRYTGQAANDMFAKMEPESCEAMKKDEGADTCSVSDDYYIIKTNEKKTYKISDDTKILMQTYGSGDDVAVDANISINYSNFKNLINGNIKDKTYYNTIPFHLEVVNGTVNSIVEQYIP